MAIDPARFRLLVGLIRLQTLDMMAKGDITPEGRIIISGSPEATTRKFLRMTALALLVKEQQKEREGRIWREGPGRWGEKGF
jgi:hypothetical protein